MSTNKIRPNQTRIRRLLCPCCGAVTRGRQFHNQDDGHGLCERCADWIPSRWPETDMERTYGVRGTHYCLPAAQGAAQ